MNKKKQDSKAKREFDKWYKEHREACFYCNGYEQGKADVLKVIDEGIDGIKFEADKLLRRRYNYDWVLKNNGILEFGVDLLEELKAKLRGKRK